MWFVCFHFFFQAEDGIRDYKVTGVQTCALPISALGPGAGCSRRGCRKARSRSATDPIRRSGGRCPRRSRIRGGRSGRRRAAPPCAAQCIRSEEHTSELQSPCNLVCRLLLEKKKKNQLRLTETNATTRWSHE